MKRHIHRPGAGANTKTSHILRHIFTVRPLLIAIIRLRRTLLES